jgi:hypothetical protein
MMAHARYVLPRPSVMSTTSPQKTQTQAVAVSYNLWRDWARRGNRGRVDISPDRLRASGKITARTCVTLYDTHVSLTHLPADLRIFRILLRSMSQPGSLFLNCPLFQTFPPDRDRDARDRSMRSVVEHDRLEPPRDERTVGGQCIERRFKQDVVVFGIDAQRLEFR